MLNIRHQAVAPTEVRVLAAGEEVDLHVHDDAQLIYASSGVLEVVVEDGTWFTPSTRAVWVPGGTPHYWQVHGATTVHLVGVPARETLSPNPPTLVLVSPLFRELLIACSAGGRAVTPVARRMLQVLLDQVRPAPARVTMLPMLHDDRLQDVQRVVEEDLTRPVTLAQVGRRVGVGERTLSRVFAREVGMSYQVWRTQLRLHRASLLLAEGYSVTAAAMACGYSTPSAFISTFRAVFGHTPGSLYRLEALVEAADDSGADR